MKLGHRTNVKMRFIDKIVIDDNDCWVWQGSRHRYGNFWFNGSLTPAHRASYEIFKGEIPEGLQIDHLCRNGLCVNPNHLEAVTSKENQARGFGFPAVNAKKTHCPQGHEYTPENTYTTKRDLRQCITCNRQRTRDWRHKMKLIKNQNGFTLVELIVVISIIVVLAAVIIPNTIRFVASGEQGSIAQESDNIQTAMTAMMGDLTIAQGDLSPNDLSTSSSGVNDFSTLPTGSPLAGYLETATTSYFYCWDSDGLITEVFESPDFCTK